MDDSRTKKITIVGGGIIGCLVALQFQKKKYDVTIIEQKKNLGGILRDFQIENDFFLQNNFSCKNTGKNFTRKK